MSQRSHARSVVTPSSPWDRFRARFEPADSRTMRRRWPAGILPSAIALVSMSIVTVATIVVIVTAIASAGLRIPSPDDPWSRWSSSAELRFGDNIAGPSGYTPVVEGQMIELAIDGEYADAAFVVPEP